MGDINHLRLVVTGGRKTAELANEIWQFGLNWMPTLGSAMADIHTPAGDFDASYDLATTSGTGYVGERNFLLEGGVTDIDPMDWLDDQVRPAIIAYLNTTGLFHSDIYVSNLECWPIGNDGNVIALPVGPAKASITPTVTTWDGQSTNAVLAPFTSFAVSTVTSANIPRGRGRFYPPPVSQTGNTNAATGLMDSAARTAYAAAAALLIESAALNQGPGDAYVRPCVIGNPWTTAYAIKGVKVGSIPDTQRRRRNSLTEVYTQDTLTLP